MALLYLEDLDAAAIGEWFANRLQNRRLQRQIDELDALRAE